jgi:hypothetical protein
MLTWFAPQGVIIELGRGHARRNQSMRGLIVEESGDQVQCLIDTPKAIEYHGCDGFPDGEVPQLRVLLRRFVHDVANAQFVIHARDKTKMIQNLTMVGLCHVISSREEIR